jgi:hypothetical protein
MQLKLIPETESLKPKTNEHLGLSIYKKIKELLVLDPHDILKCKRSKSLKSKTEQKNNETMKLLNLLEKGKLKTNTFKKELVIKQVENEKLIAVLQTELEL